MLNSLVLRRSGCDLKKKAIFNPVWLFDILRSFYYPRPVLAFGYCRCLRLSVCVYQSLACPRNNSGLKSQNLPKFELVRTITHFLLKLGSPNLGQRCKIVWLRSLLLLVAIDVDLQGQIWLKKLNFLVTPLLEIHNHHITTREPWVPRLLHRPDCFMVSILCEYLYA